jgi:hypothetical protein
LRRYCAYWKAERMHTDLLSFSPVLLSTAKARDKQ